MKTIIIKTVINDINAKKVLHHFKKYIKTLDISYCTDIQTRQATNKESAVYKRVACALSHKYELEDKVKISKDGLNHQNSFLYSRPDLKPGTVGNIVAIDHSDMSTFPYVVKFGENIINCAFHEITKE
jgi:hypothetical protein